MTQDTADAKSTINFEKYYTPHEENALKAWEEFLKTDNIKNKSTEPDHSFTSVSPPPNVTGNLHLGHAMIYTTQDLYLRFNALKGKSIHCIYGTDHAGISTQMQVTKHLDSIGTPVKGLSREQFLLETEKWVNQYKHIILDQQKKLGCIYDASETAYTFDASRSKTVIHAFVKLYHDKKIYRAHRLVNWNIVQQTAVSDLEVESREESTFMWSIAYEVFDEHNQPTNQTIIIATTRPETLFADQAIAVNPEDERYTRYTQKPHFAKIPLSGRLIPIIQDSAVAIDKGTGALKVTPAHDFVDFEIGKRHHLKPLNILNKNGTLNDEVPEKYRTLNMHKARIMVVADLKELNIIIAETPHVHMAPYAEKTNVKIEPMLTWQWFVDAPTLAKKCLDFLDAKETTFIPDSYENVYRHWLTHMEPWCISRQILWGHRIPVWNDENGVEFCAQTEQEAQFQAQEYYGNKNTAPVHLVQVEDVLDTWFSSSLWPLSVWEWPEKEVTEITQTYPADFLPTGHDILFFWVARMAMMCGYFTDQAPFKKVLLLPLIRDKNGKKMSKTVGNVVDPLILIAKYNGPDALRYALVNAATENQNLNFDEAMVMSAQRFITKIWNSFRLGATREIKLYTQTPVISHPWNKWVIRELHEFVDKAENFINLNRTHEYAKLLYHFWWNHWCDWYLEGTKALLKEDADLTAEISEVMGYGMHIMIQVMHPLMPFLSETLNDLMRPEDDKRSVLQKKWPQMTSCDTEPQEACIAKDLVSEIRILKTQLVKEGVKSIFYVLFDKNVRIELSQWRFFIEELAGVIIIDMQPDAAVPYRQYDGSEWKMFCETAA